MSVARGIVTISEPMADAIAEEHFYPRDRIAVIPNGYEPTPALNPLESVETLDPLKIVHVGTVIPRNRPDLFLETIAHLNRNGSLPSARFRFVGNLSRDYIREIGLNGIVESTGLVGRDIARHEMESAPALLLLVGQYVGRWGYNAKLFEYIQTGRPILCLEESPGSNDASLLRQFAPDRSFFAKLDNPAAITSAINSLRGYLQKTPRSALHLPPDFMRFSRTNLAAQLAEFLNGLL